ncbi:Clathrin heavy chain 1 [Porphyridium purpureum]|uniref:Clathrin heavy chain n=1 Tax=Porphyridium purpureum TaxID=35688 RepID=A0A5J4YNQ7_PORPP|nr:Clathrin heavy chain 1 [Porphyridium purpureum]|eukprot:POR3721..scf222_8
MGDPVEVHEHLNLTSAAAIDAASLSFATVTLQSEKYVCVRDRNAASGSAELVVVELDTAGSGVMRKPMAADSAIMNPRANIIALKAGMALQIFDLTKKQKVKAVQISENVVFWKWISDKTIGIVTETAVYHWALSDAAGDPVKMFDRHNSMTRAQIINYRADASEQWLVLVGIAPGAAAGAPVTGRMQLYSVARKMSQALEGHAATFASISLGGYDTSVLAFASLPAAAGSSPVMHMIEVGTERKPENAPRFDKKSIPLQFPPQCTAAGDFPIAMDASTKYAVVFMLTKMGFLYVYEISTGTCLYTRQVSNTSVFVTCANTETGGIFGVNRAGQVLSIQLVPERVIPYVMSSTSAGSDPAIVARIAAQSGFPGADGLFVNKFRQFFDAGRLREAALVASQSPGTSVRNKQTIELFKALPQEEGQPPALLVYFQVLLERGKLNKLESIELAQQVIALGRVQLLEKWIQDDKMECSEELGDLLKTRAGNLPLAMTVYVKGGAHHAVLRALIENGQTAKVVPYAQRVQMSSVNIPELVQLASTHGSPQAALELANALQQSGLPTASAASAAGERSMQDIESMFHMFMQKGMLQEATAYVVDNLGEDVPEAGHLQTTVLKANLANAPQLADAILKRKIWSHYNHVEVAQQCERAGLYSHALTHYKDITDVRRVLSNTTHTLEPELVLEYFDRLLQPVASGDGSTSTSPANSNIALECLDVLLRANPRGNLGLCVQIAAAHVDVLGATALMGVFGKLKQPQQAQQATFALLQGIINKTDDADVHYAYIELAIRLEQFGEAEKVTRESEHYNPEKVKSFLMSVKPRDPRPLINVCDRFSYVEELVRFLIKNNQPKFVEGYVTRINPTRASTVCGILLDLDYEEEFIKNLVMQVKNTVNVGELVVTFEKHNKLKMLLPFLEAKLNDGGSEDSEVCTGLAKVYVDANISPEHFLETNEFYDPRAVGQYCENRDPYLSVLAYRRGKGSCDAELLNVTNKNALFKEQAKYVVEREDAALWAQVLSDSNTNRKLLVDQVMSSALPEQQAPEKVSATVKAFMAADLPQLLIELLEKLVLSSSPGNAVFAKNRNLQNLLILTSIKTEKDRAMEYIKKLENYDGNDIAQICLGAELYEEAFTIFSRFNKYDEAVGVILDEMNDFPRAEAFAEKLDRPEVWSRLGKAQLKKRDMVGKGVTSLLRAKDPGPYESVIHACKDFEPDAATYDAIIKYLKFARTKVQDVIAVDTEIVVGLARCDRLTEVEEFLSMPNHSADLDEAGERCLAQDLLKAAKLLFSATNSYGRLAVVLVKLRDFAGAAESARKSNKVATWRSVCFACVDAGEFRLAQICGLHLVVEPDELQDVLTYYQQRGFFNELLDLLDASLSMERAHQALFTETGVMYTKYRLVEEHKVMEFMRMWWQRCSVPKLIRACDAAAAWPEKVYLHIQYNEAENALQCMMEHPIGWDHAVFLQAVNKASNTDVLYRCISFYMNEHFDLLQELLVACASRTDPQRVISMLKTSRLLPDAHQELGDFGVLPFFKTYLLKLQEKQNIPEVNEALNEVLLLEENVEMLKESIKSHVHFDQLKFARKLEHAQAIEYRRISATLYTMNKKFEQAVEVSKRDKLWKDAIESASVSKDPELVDFLSRFFLDNDLREGFSATLLACYEFYPPAAALEYAWMYNVMDFAMPFFVQTMDEMFNRVMGLEQVEKERVLAHEAEKKALEETINDDPSVLLHGVQGSPAAAMLANLSGAGASGTGQLALGWQS